jgi:hypothetical protein
MEEQQNTIYSNNWTSSLFLSKPLKPHAGIHILPVIFLTDHVFIRTTKEPANDDKSRICQNTQNADRKSTGMSGLPM